MSRNYKFHNKQGLYFVSFTTINWIDVFTRQVYFDVLAESVSYCRKEKGMELYCYCFMPSHIHFIFRSANGFSYVYQYKDHLGNVRLSYTDTDKDGVIKAETEIVEESNYYPFGLKHKGYNNVTQPIGNSTAQKFGFGGKELNEELGLEWHDFEARNYDASLGRWMNVDPHADNYYNSSPYTYALNSPLYFVDPDGKDNIVYLVLLESADRDQVNSIIEATNARFKDLGLKTTVQGYEGKDMFESSNLDDTDSFGIIGTTKEISTLLEENPDNFKGISNTSTSDINNPENIELADRSDNGSGTGFLLKTDSLKGAATTYKTTENNVASWTIMHALGHNSGSGHLSTDKAIMSSGSLVGNTVRPESYWKSSFGGRTTEKISGVSSFNDIFNPSINKAYGPLIKSKMGNNSPKDNYTKNDKSRVGPRRQNGKF